MSDFTELYSGALDAKWHAFFFDALQNEKGHWLQITETRSRGRRQTIVIEQERTADFQRELLKAVSAVCAAAHNDAHSASAVRPRAYEPWSSEEDQVLRFLFGSGAGLAQIASALQRERSAIRSRLKHLEVEVREA